MNEKDLNIKYIREKTGLVENDELIPIILEMIQESYKAGLCQAEYDNTMGLVEENQQLKEQLERSEKARKEAIEYINNPWILSDYKIGSKLHDYKSRAIKILDIDKGE